MAGMVDRVVNLSRPVMRRIRRLCNRPAATWFLGIWSFAEALIWFILPDVLLLPYAIATPQKLRQWLITALGPSLLGTLILLIIAMLWPEPIGQTVLQLPFTSESMLIGLQSVQTPDILKQSVSGIPTKVWTLAALEYHWNWATFLLLLGISRGLRMTIVLLVGRWLSGQRWVEDYWFFWVLLYPPAVLAGLILISRA